MNGKLNRKDFIKGLMYIMLLPLLFLLNRMVKDHKRFGSTNKELRLSNAIPSGLSISNEVIFYKSEQELKIYSARCSHLGCKINQIEDDEIVCPCHGSRYNAEGKPIKGPSIKRLQSLDYEMDETMNKIVIKLNS